MKIAQILIPSVSLAILACGSVSERGAEPLVSEAKEYSAYWDSNSCEGVGLGLYFYNGEWNPDMNPLPNPSRPTQLQIVDGDKRYMQELYLASSVPTTLERGLDPVMESGDFAGLDWSGIQEVGEDWRLEASGFTYQRQIFYRDAEWMRADSEFKITAYNRHGQKISELKVDAGRDDDWHHSDDAFERRFVARVVSTGCAAQGVCDNPEALHFAQAFVQLRTALHPQRDFDIPRNASYLKFKWSEYPGHSWRVDIRHDRPGDTGYGFGVELAEISPPARGYYLPGENIQVRVTFVDGDGVPLFPEGSLPTFRQMLGRENASKGLRYLTFSDFPMLYWAHKDLQADMETFFGGPLHKMTTVGSTPITPFVLFNPQIQSADRLNDGWNGFVQILPPTPITFGCLLDPSSPACDAPVSDVFSFAVPADAEAGTYVVGLKARREWEGEPMQKAGSIRVQVGTDVLSDFPEFHVVGMDNNCASCHVGRAALPVAAHGFEGLNKVGPECLTCHTNGYYFEPDAAIDTRLRYMHDTTRRLFAP
ncbi:MAG: hypothetical protein K8R69_10685 [Deltaproteobacteria bacterium]|nr:hypothetical protein [Deltaproteobacteria bacterium]